MDAVDIGAQRSELELDPGGLAWSAAEVRARARGTGGACWVGANSPTTRPASCGLTLLSDAHSTSTPSHSIAKLKARSTQAERRMPPTQQPTLRIQNTTAFPLEVVVPSPQQATTIATAVAARGAAQLPPPTVSSSRRSAVSIWVTRADGETLVFTEDRKRRKRGGEGWSAMVLTPSGTGSAAASAASYGHPSDSTSTLDDALPKPSWPLKAFYHKVTIINARAATSLC
jgi:hypothetical protein